MTINIGVGALGINEEVEDKVSSLEEATITAEVKSLKCLMKDTYAIDATLQVTSSKTAPPTRTPTSTPYLTVVSPAKKSGKSKWKPNQKFS